jgi:hypothetical protein
MSILTWLERDRSSLVWTLALVSLAWAAAAAFRYRHEPSVVAAALACPVVALLLVRLDLSLGWRTTARSDIFSTVAAFVFTLAVWTISIVLWRRAGGFFGVRDTGESASIYLAAYNVRDLVSFVLQEHAATSDPAALGYFYIHHPNFISRALAMPGIAAGMSLEKLILCCLMLSALSLLVGYLALRRLFGPIAALATIGFFASSYGIYFAQAGDLLRGLHAVMLWLLVYVAALDWEAPRRSLGRSVALAILFFFIASSDWAFFLFSAVFYVLWDIYAHRRLEARYLLASVLMPCGLAFLGYFLVIIAHSGLEFFLNDLLVTYFGRMGNVLAGPLLGQVWDPEKFRQLYQAKHIVMWDVNPSPVHLRDIVSAYWLIMSAGSAWIARLIYFVFLACVASSLLRVSQLRLARVAALGAFGILAYGNVYAPLVVALLLYVILGLHRLRPKSVGEPALRALLDLAAWVTIVLIGIVIVALALPDYVSWSWTRGVSPMGMADAAAFGLLCHVLCSVEALGRALAWLRTPLAEAMKPFVRLREVLASGDPEPSSARAPLQPSSLGSVAGIAALAILCGGQLLGNLLLCRELPPMKPAFADTLRGSRFHGKLFVSNVIDALVWYFTRGTSLVTTRVPPDLESSTTHFRHLRDGDNVAKYAHPDYFLCDNDPYFAFQRTAEIGGKICEMPAECSCREVAHEMSKQGQSPVVVTGDYAIVKLK